MWVRGYIETTTDSSYGSTDLLGQENTTRLFNSGPGARVAVSTPPYVPGCTVAKVYISGLYQFAWTDTTPNPHKLGFQWGVTCDDDYGFMQPYETPQQFDPDADWMAYGYQTVPNEFVRSTPIALGSLFIPFSMECSSKRKLQDPGDSCFYTWEAGQGHTVDALQLIYSVLLLLP